MRTHIGGLAVEMARRDRFKPDLLLARANDVLGIEERMREIIREDVPFIYRKLEADEARRLFADQPYKLEIIQAILSGTLDPDGRPRALVQVSAAVGHRRAHPGRSLRARTPVARRRRGHGLTCRRPSPTTAS